MLARMAPIIDATLRRALLDFFDAARRDLPWRRTSDPYHVWVSEIMLQQTRVETVIPYFERWLERFPTLDALADAPIDDVLKCWEGLGYYARARNLHRAARLVRERYAGVVPDDPDALRELPGVGDYTAGAIASIAYGRPEPAVDGNVRRVLSRLFDLEDPTPAELRGIAAALVDGPRPGDLNQALMELGATVCVPRAPACTACPVSDHCRAYAAGTQAERPARRGSKPVPERDVGTAVLVAPDGRLLLVRRPEDGLLGGLWEFPGAEARPGESVVEAAERAARAASGADALPRGEPLGQVAHIFTHLRARYHVFRFELTGLEPDSLSPGGSDSATGTATNPQDRAWIAPGELGAYALPRAQQRIAALALHGR